jgi:hypothetical protein
MFTRSHLKRPSLEAKNWAYDMKVLKRATIVGEVTGGGASPGD